MKNFSDLPGYNRNMEKIIGPDTSQNVIHNIYPEGLDVPENMMDPNIGGKLKKCRHIYEYVNNPICPDCGRDTHEADFETTAKIIRQHYANGDDKPYICDICNGTIRIWWSI